MLKQWRVFNKIAQAADPLLGRSKRRDLARFYRFVIPHKKLAVFAGSAMAVSVLLALPVPLLTMFVIDQVLPSQDRRLLLGICAVVLAVLVVRTGAAFLQQYFFSRLKARVVFHLRVKVLKHLQALPLSFFQKNHSAYLASRVSRDCEQAAQGLMADSLLSCIRECLTFLVGLVILSFLHLKLTLLVSALLPFFLLSILRANRLVRKCSSESMEYSARSTKTLQESLSSIYVVKAFAAEKREVIKNIHRLRDALTASRKTELVSAGANLVSSFIGALAPVILLLYGGLEIMRGQLTIGQLVAFSTYIGYLFGPIESLVMLNIIAQGSLTALARVFELLDTPVRVQARLLKPSLAEPLAASGIEFQGVSFRYSESEPFVLRQVSFKVGSAETVALVGPSGMGKSTLLNLMMGFLQPEEGRILIGGRDLREWDMRALRKRIGLVPQEQMLFTGSIAENIAYGKVGASREEIIQAAQVANAHEFILAQKDGYETQLGEKGSGLSTGQKQRLGIARAILPDPPILIFDEATSSVDPRSERLIQQALRSLTRNRACIVVGHRMSTVRIADRVLALNPEGGLDEIPHSQLGSLLEESEGMILPQEAEKEDSLCA